MIGLSTLSFMCSYPRGGLRCLLPYSGTVTLNSGQMGLEGRQALLPRSKQLGILMKVH